jgi:hypothetical protein
MTRFCLTCYDDKITIHKYYFEVNSNTKSNPYEVDFKDVNFKDVNQITYDLEEFADTLYLQLYRLEIMFLASTVTIARLVAMMLK